MVDQLDVKDEPSETHSYHGEPEPSPIFPALEEPVASDPDLRTMLVNRGIPSILALRQIMFPIKPNQFLLNVHRADTVCRPGEYRDETDGAGDDRSIHGAGVFGMNVWGVLTPII